jgi:hypothetical protein
MRDEDRRRFVRINLPHARTVALRIGRSLDALGALGARGNGHSAPLLEAYDALDRALQPWDEDPPPAGALAAADAVAEKARALVEAILASPARGDRLGQNVRNLFECLGLSEEGAELALDCGERPDSPLR